MYSWLRYKVMPPSFQGKNRLWIERSSRFKRIWVRFGTLFRNERWTNYEKENLQFTFLLQGIKNLYYLFVVFSFFFLGFIFFSHQWIGETNFNIVFWNIWSLIDANDYASLVWVWLSHVLTNIFFEIYYVIHSFNYSTLSNPINLTYRIDKFRNGVYQTYSFWRNCLNKLPLIGYWFDFLPIFAKPSLFQTPTSMLMFDWYYTFTTRYDNIASGSFSTLDSLLFHCETSPELLQLIQEWREAYSDYFFDIYDQNNNETLIHNFILNERTELKWNKRKFFFFNNCLYIELPSLSFIHFPARTFLFFHDLIMQIWKENLWFYRYNLVTRDFMNSINFHSILKSFLFYVPRNENFISVLFKNNNYYPIDFFFHYLDSSFFWYLKRFSFMEGHNLRSEYAKKIFSKVEYFVPSYPLSPTYLLLNSFDSHFESNFFHENFFTYRYRLYNTVIEDTENSLFSEEFDITNYLLLRERKIYHFFLTRIYSSLNVSSQFQTSTSNKIRPITNIFDSFLYCFEINQMDNLTVIDQEKYGN